MAFYKDGVISIPNVTGDVVITATAVQNDDPNLLITLGYDVNTRISSTGVPKAETGYYTIKNLPVSNGDEIYIYSILTPSPSSYGLVVSYDSDGNYVDRVSCDANRTVGTNMTAHAIDSNGVKRVSITSSNIASIRFCFVPSMGLTIDDCIVYKNQPIA